MAPDIETITALARQYTADVCHCYPVKSAFLFGSHANGTSNEHSDIDICFFLDSYNEKDEFDILLHLYRIKRNYKKINFDPKIFEFSDIGDDNPMIKEILQTGKDLLIAT